MEKIYLVTGNSNKLREWQAVLPDDMEIGTVDVDLDEIQSDDAIGIVTDKVKRAYAEVGKPVVVEDVEAGLEKLNGLPGPFIKFFLKRLGKDALYHLAGAEGEKATIACTIGYYDGQEILTVQGKLDGTVVAPRGEGFGFDATFQPAGESETFGEMGEEKKNTLSHRKKAIEMLVKELQERR